MDFQYANEKTALMIVALLKKHGIKKVVASPGTTNMCLNICLQHDGSFEMYSCIDERSAAYMACGLSAESGEPVVITCTEATASRNYLPGLTEAYHRKLPILAITGTHGTELIGHLSPQTIDRTVSPNDCFRLKVNLPILKDEKDVWESQLKINQAILELYRHGGGPVHINMPMPKSVTNFSVNQLPEVRSINRYFVGDRLPEMPNGKIVIFAGSHKCWSKQLEKTVDNFCEQYNSVVLCDFSSRFYGKYAAHAYPLASQNFPYALFQDIELVIHIGEEAADEPTMKKLKSAKRTWRVSEDGELRDTFGSLEYVFEMKELDFFQHYTDRSAGGNTGENGGTYLKEFKECLREFYKKIPELPLSNVFAASKIMPQIPENSVIVFGASNTIRAWSFYELADGVRADANMGCRGIDGVVSTSVGISLAHPDQICYCILGDLTFYYDMSILGNRHIGNNYRILVINNCGGNLFKQPGAPAHYMGDENADLFVAAGGHYGGKGSDFIRKYAEALGFQYLSASNKEEFERIYKKFVSKEESAPMLFEVITSDKDEGEAFDIIRHTIMDPKAQIKHQAKKVLGEKGTGIVQGILKSQKK